MRRFDRRTLGAAVASLAASVVTPAGATVGLATKLYVGHAARLTARIPASWSVDPNSDFDYLGDDGFFVSEPVAGATLDEACAALAASWRFDRTATVTPTTWAGGPARRVSGQSAGADAVALVLPHPRPFETLWGEAYAFAALTADPGDLDEIVATVDFSPERVTPAVFVSSVLEMVEARAYWAGGVDWGVARRAALSSIEVFQTVWEAQGQLLGVVDALRAAGDNHSFLVLSDSPAPFASDVGAGMLVGGRVVVAVFPDSPAARAGVLAGDTLEAADGQPFAPTEQALEPGGLWGPSVELTLRRAGTAAVVVVTVEQGPYDTYLSPTGRRLPDRIGYVALPHAFSPGRDTEYAATADRIVAAVDERATRGWVVDLRLDRGGSYSPMVTGVGSILGNGRFVGWRSASGRQWWVSHEDGRITQDGREVSDYLGPDGPTTLHRPSPPVAVLVGPSTASSGEVTTLAFVGRPDARLFGERTAGRTTSIVGYPLFDGSHLGLAVAAMTDRTGATHSDGVEPDEPVATDWTTYGTAEDPVIAAAMDWLGQQPVCGDAGDR